MSHVPRTIHCGDLCTHHPISPQYPGAPGAPPPLVNIGGGTLPFTGLDFAPLLGFIVLAVVLYASARAVCWLSRGEW